MELKKGKLEIELGVAEYMFICPNELLQDPEKAKEAWPKFSSDTNFITQIEQRAAQSKNIRTLFDTIPKSTPIEEVIDTEQIPITDMVDFFSSLADVLNNPSYERLLLYLPFEILLSVNFKAKNALLQKSIDTFITIYMKAWSKLLRFQDVRANFVDGDVLEVELRTADLPRVVKAAHLIPELIKKNYLETYQVLQLAQQVQDPILKESLYDALVALRSKNQVEDYELDRLGISLDSAYKIKSETTPDKTTEARSRWLQEKQEEAIVLSKAQQISKQILLGEELDLNLDPAIFLESFRLAIVQLATNDLTLAQNLFGTFKQKFVELKDSPDISIQNQFTKVLRHCHSLKVIDTNTMNEFAVYALNLDVKLSERLSDYPNDVKSIQEIIKLIESDPLVSERVLPLVLFGGSKIKGYSDTNSDTDVYIFIKPNTPESLKDSIRSNIWPLFNAVNTKPIEFWLQEQGGQLRIKDDMTEDNSIGESDWTHILFNSVWIGDQDTIRVLTNRLLPAYFNTDIADNEVRNRYLENLERDSLQYRLMHKGYEKEFPLLNSNYIELDSIDGKSAFWDPGYRRLATQLFLSRVFLPKLDSTPT
jgi:hypothetical protein